jgi:hypothetical protein
MPMHKRNNVEVFGRSQRFWRSWHARKLLGKSFFHGSVSMLKNSSSFGKLTAKWQTAASMTWPTKIMASFITASKTHLYKSGGFLPNCASLCSSFPSFRLITTQNRKMLRLSSLQKIREKSQFGVTAVSKFNNVAAGDTVKSNFSG